MANYKETTVTGTSYQRAWRVEIENGLVDKHIRFYEEVIAQLDAGHVVSEKVGVGVWSPFTAENMFTEFAVLNPETGEDTGATMTYADVYTALYSLYIYLAIARDEFNAHPDRQADPAA